MTDKMKKLKSEIVLMKGITLKTGFFEGRPHLIAPVVMLTEGVHNSYFYPEEELSRHTEAWNGRPVVVYHPEEKNEAISANKSPQVVEQTKVGTIFNTIYDKDGKKLKAEIWLDIAKLNKVDNSIITMLNDGKILEVSTGLFVDGDAVPGEWKGEKYEAIFRNYRPDHLALLPNTPGACSVADGCGVRNNSAEVVDGELALTAIVDLLYKKIEMSSDGQYTGNMMRQVYSDYLTYEDMKGNLYRQNYKIKKGGEVVLKGDPEKVKKLVSYETMASKDKSFMKEGAMDKNEKIDFVMNTKSMEYGEDMKAVLEASDEKALDVHVSLAKKFRECDCKKAELETNEKKKEEDKVVENKKKPATVQEYIADAPDEVKEVIANGVRIHNERKNAIVKSLVENKRNKFSQERLVKMSLDELESLAALAQVDLDFSGQKGETQKTFARNEKNSDGTGVPVAPELTWDKPVNNNRSR